MALAPNTRSLGETARQKAQEQKSSIVPIRLGSSPILDPMRPTPPGVVFSTTGEYGDLSEALDCCGRYTLRNTNHTSSVCVNAAGNMIFAIHSCFGGRNFISLGGFDPLGNPIVPSEEDRKVLFNIVPTAEKVLVMDAKYNSGPLGIKYNGQNPRIGVYPSYKEITFDFGFSLQDDKWKLDVDTTQGLDWKGNSTRQEYRARGQYDKAFLGGSYARVGSSKSEMIEAGFRGENVSMTGRHQRAGGVTTDMIEATYKGDNLSVTGRHQRAGGVTTETIEAAYKAGDYAFGATGTRSGANKSHSLDASYTGDQFSLGAKHTRSGSDRNTQINGSLSVGKRVTLTAFYKTKEPGRPTNPTETVNVEDLGKVGLTVKIDM